MEKPGEHIKLPGASIFSGEINLALYQLFLCVCGSFARTPKFPHLTQCAYVVGLERANMTTTTTPKAIAAFPLHISSVSN